MINKEFIDRWPSGKGEGWVILLNGESTLYSVFSFTPNESTSIEIVPCIISNTSGCRNGQGQVHFAGKSKYLYQEYVFDTALEALRDVQESYRKFLDSVDERIKDLRICQGVATKMVANIEIREN